MRAVAAPGRHAGHADRRLDLTVGCSSARLGPSDVSRYAGGVPGVRARHLVQRARRRRGRHRSPALRSFTMTSFLHSVHLFTSTSSMRSSSNSWCSCSSFLSSPHAPSSLAQSHEPPHPPPIGSVPRRSRRRCSRRRSRCRGEKARAATWALVRTARSVALL